ncbi:protein transport protein bos1 [Puccinia graminis f. sp. tritici]|uniref:Protein transport protein BOS1 n=1 Tax=Puccinia graminis f. sp. tritici TaxID=56615 RepID=A0A5B0RM31_PUCGR|nr:protein transport protein bos1 [Puccinia graminis f. sp. tritici]KAA1126991.1 protein transport protein bos1 [Puccinia graminis f. sp. tritici]
MNSLYSLALRQTSSIQAELTELEKSITSSTTRNNTAGLHGQIAASLSSLQRTLDDYQAMSKAEVVDSKRAKAAARIEKFKDDFLALKKQFDQIKTLERTLKEESQRQELFQSNSTSYRTNAATHSSPTTAESPYQTGYHRTNAAINSRAGGGGGAGYRTNSALDENHFLQQTNSTLDIYIAQGQAILGNLGDQRDMLKGTQKKLRSAANVLGLSRETIQFIERRSKADFILFGIGATFTLVSFYFILKLFG